MKIVLPMVCAIERQVRCFSASGDLKLTLFRCKLDMSKLILLIKRNPKIGTDSLRLEIMKWTSLMVFDLIRLILLTYAG